MRNCIGKDFHSPEKYKGMWILLASHRTGQVGEYGYDFLSTLPSQDKVSSFSNFLALTLGQELEHVGEQDRKGP